MWYLDVWKTNCVWSSFFSVVLWPRNYVDASAVRRQTSRSTYDTWVRSQSVMSPDSDLIDLSMYVYCKIWPIHYVDASAVRRRQMSRFTYDTWVGSQSSVMSPDSDLIDLSILLDCTYCKIWPIHHALLRSRYHNDRVVVGAIISRL